MPVVGFEPVTSGLKSNALINTWSKNQFTDIVIRGFTDNF